MDSEWRENGTGLHVPFMHQGIGDGIALISAREASSCVRNKNDCLFLGCNTRWGYRSLIVDKESGLLRGGRGHGDARISISGNPPVPPPADWFAIQ